MYVFGYFTILYQIFVISIFYSISKLRGDVSDTDAKNILEIMGSVRDDYIWASLQEASAYVQFISGGGSDAQWEIMEDQERFKLVQDEPLEFLQSKRVSLDGFMLADLGREDPIQWSKLPRQVCHYLSFYLVDGRLCPIRKKTVHRFQDIVEEALVRQYPKVAIDPKQHCHIGHMLHGLIRVARETFPKQSWCSRLAIVDLTCDQKTTLLWMQGFANHVLGLLSHDSHWAFVLSDFLTQTSILYDSRGDPAIEKRARSWTKTLEEYYGELTFRIATVPVQKDDWSSGHRVVIGAELVLADLHIPDDDGVCGPPLTLDEEDFGEDVFSHLPELIEVGVKHEVLGTGKVKRECDPQPDIVPSKKTKTDQSTPDKSGSKKRFPDKGDSPLLPHAKRRVGADQGAPPKPARIDWDFGDSEQGVDETKEKPDKNLGFKQSGMKKTATKLRLELQGKGLDHNKVFQVRHAQLGQPEPRGHWANFFQEIIQIQDSGGSSKLACSACESIYQEFVHNIPLEDQDLPKPNGMDTGELGEHQGQAHAHSLEIRKKGRPTRSNPKVENFLCGWIIKNRSGIYHAYDDSSETFTYRCLPCRKDVQFRRDSLTYLARHEKCCDSHKKGLMMLGLSIDGVQEIEVKPCTGAIILPVHGQMGQLEYSLRAWCTAGQPTVLGDRNKTVLELCNLKEVDGKFVLRHANCSGVPASNSCELCKSLVFDPKLVKDIGTWGWKVDLASLAYLSAYGSQDDIDHLRHTMMNQDYRKLGLAGGDIEKWFGLSPRDLIFKIRRYIESSSFSRRNAALQDFITVRLRGLAEYSLGDLQKNVFSTMVSKFSASMMDGTVLEEDHSWKTLEKSFGCCGCMLSFVVLCCGMMLHHVASYFSFCFHARVSCYSML